MSSDSQKLFSKNFTLITFSSFFVSWSLYLTLTIFPIFLIDELEVSGTITGIILALFPFGALLCRPLAGWLSDSFPRKKTAFCAICGFLVTGIGYFYLTNPFALALCRLFQGFSFSVASTTLSTIAIEIIPERKMGTGVGIYSSNYSLAMIVGPMVSFFLFALFEDSSSQGYKAVFALAVFSCVLSLISLFILSNKSKIPIKRASFSKDNIILRTGLSSTFCLTCVALMYSLFLNYVALYVKSIGLPQVSSSFFMFMGIGLVLNRMISGVVFDKGYVMVQTLFSAFGVVALTFIFLEISNPNLFYATAFGLGFSYGALIPTFQTLLVQFAKENEKGLASSTYFIAFDIGTMLALFGGGVIIDMFSMQAAFYIAMATQVLWIFVFIFLVMPEYRAMKEKKSLKA